MLWTTYLTTVFVHTVYAWTMTDPSLVFLGPPRRGGSVPKRFEAINDQTQCHVGPRDEKEESVTRIHKNSLSQFWCLIPRCGHKDATLDSTRFNQMILVRLDWFIWCCGPHFVVSQSVFLVLLLWSFGTGSATIGQAVSEQQPPPRFWGVQIPEKNCGVQCVPGTSGYQVERPCLWSIDRFMHAWTPKKDARSISHAQKFAENCTKLIGCCYENFKLCISDSTHTLNQAIQSAWINWESGDEGGVLL